VILPTRRALWSAAAAALLALAGYWIPGARAALVVVDLALIAGICFDFWSVPRPGITRESSTAFSVGRSTPVAYRWANPSIRRLRLRVREVRPDLLGGLQPPRELTVEPRATLTETVHVVPARRGRTRGDDGAMVVDARGPLGLGVRRGTVKLPWGALVYPPLTAARLASVAEARRHRAPGLTPVRRIVGEGRQFESLRDWVPGDDLHHIDWKATARRRKVMLRQYEVERRQQVVLVIDTGRLLSAQIGGGTRLDYVVRAALDLAYAASELGDDIGVMAFSEGVDHFVAPAPGRRGLRSVVEVLAVLEPHLAEPDYPGAFRYLALRNRKRALTVVFTDLIDRLASQALVANVAALRARHLPLAVTLRNSGIDAIAALRPTVAADAYRKAAAEELLRAREDALAVMRGGGVVVLDVPPERAAEGVVTQYLALKRRGRL